MIKSLLQLQNTFWLEHQFIKGQYKKGKRHLQYSDKVQHYFSVWLEEKEKYNLVLPELLDQATLTS